MRLFILAMIAFVVVASHDMQSHSAGRTFEGAATSHCESWSKEIPKDGADRCRRRASPQSNKAVLCRLKSQTVNEETGDYMCSFSKPGWMQDDFKMIMEPGFHCPRTIKC